MTAKQLRKIRKDRGLSQREAAKELGITQGRMSQLESGYYSDQISNGIADKVIETWNLPPGDYYVPLPVPEPKDSGYIEDDLPRDVHGTPDSCKGCIHRTKTGSISICDYLQDIGVPRGCLVKGCRHYEKGQREDKCDKWNNGIG